MSFTRYLRPSLGDVVLAAFTLQLFYLSGNWFSLLADGDTGWHIRTGEWILQNRTVPTADLFSFARPGEPWFAWEWLSDVLFALAHRPWGLTGVAIAAGCVILLSVMILFRHMLWRGANVVAAFALMLLVIGCSSIHYLARPHVFTLLFMAVSLWLIEHDRWAPNRWIWVLVPLSAVWVNLHGGFFALPVTLAAFAAGLLLEAWLDPHDRAAHVAGARRYGLLSAATLASSVVNPYGVKLHLHVGRYMTSDWIRNLVQEFQAPDFRSESLLRFEALLFAALLLAGWLISRRRFADAGLVILWGHMSLTSVRHVPVFALVAAPIVAVEISRLWEAWALRAIPTSAGRIVWSLGADMGPSFRRFSAWALAVPLSVWLFTPAAFWPRTFPEARFPVKLVEAEQSHIRGKRVFTTDQWGDYLIYRFWPRQKAFVDGRSDYYGPAVGDEYIALMHGRRGWEKLFEKYGFESALVPADWPLAALLETSQGWRKVSEDTLAVVYVRTGTPPSTTAPRAETRR